MKVISWNMNYWQQKETNDYAWHYMVSQVCPDIALLQEAVVPEQYKRQTKLREYNKCYRCENEKWGTAIYISDKMMKNGSMQDVTLEFISSENDIGKQIFVELFIESGRKIVVSNLHTNTSPNNDTSIKDHLETIFDDKLLGYEKDIIIGGDFNADKEMSNGYFKKIFDKIEKKYYECLPKHTQTYFGHQMAKDNHYQDDHIYLSKNIFEKVEKIFSWNYGKIKNLSDHTIVELEIDI